jgi:L-ascorbate metabolism protein UlaG (beta-lactamase superfamily)
MGPREAAKALELLGTKRCVPCHYGTFPLLHGTPQQLKELAPNVDVAEIQPGESVSL